MSKVSGHGGFWVKPGPSHEGVIVHNAEYEVLTHIVVRETRSAGCGGWTEGLPKVRRVDHATFKVAEDDVFYPQALGITEGTEQIFYLKRGALGQYDYLYRTIVESVRVMNDQKKARWVEIVCKHGVYERGVPAPLLTPPPEEEEED